MENFTWIRQISPNEINNKVQTKFKEKNTQTAFRPTVLTVHNGLMQKVNIFCMGNDHLYVYRTPTRNRGKLDEGITLIFVSEKNRPLL